MADTRDWLTTVELTKATGLSYRQLDHYLRDGYISADRVYHEGGSGRYRQWDPWLVEPLLAWNQLVKMLGSPQKHHLPMELLVRVLSDWDRQMGYPFIMSFGPIQIIISDPRMTPKPLWWDE